MSQLFYFLTSPLFHAMLTLVAFAFLVTVPFLERSRSFRFGVAATILFVWFQTITLCLGYYVEPGYGIVSVLVDVYEDVIPPIIPLAVLLVGGTMSTIFGIVSSALDSGPQRVLTRRLARASSTLH